ncbi:MAG: MFS transporter [Rhodospirillaceae bacterium]|jgi:MFS family permease|nr:MFS transporter [Rhodospirillaceae bacterium]
MTEHTSSQTRWSLILLSLAIGVSVAGYVGKAPPAIPGMRAELSLSLITAGWVVSIFSAMGSITGMMTGILADRIGRVKMILLALATISFGSILGAYAHSAEIILLSRLLEGAGYIGTMAILPALIARLSSDRHRGLAVSLWSSVTPLGMAIAMVAAPAVIEPIGWRGLWWVTAGFTIFFLIIGIISYRGIDAKTPKNKQPYWANIKKTISRPGPWLLAICFLTYTFQWMAIMVWLPTFVIEERGSGLGLAATLAAAGVIINIFGNLFGAWLVHRGAVRWLMVTIGTTIMGTTSLFIFPDLLPDLARFGLVLVFSFFGGLQPTALLASVPLHSPSEAQLGATNGVLYQGSQIGQLLGPPVVALVVTYTGTWEQAGWVLFLGTMINLALAQWIRILEKPVIK